MTGKRNIVRPLEDWAAPSELSNHVLEYQTTPDGCDIYVDGNFAGHVVRERSVPTNPRRSGPVNRQPAPVTRWHHDTGRAYTRTEAAWDVALEHLRK